MTALAVFAMRALGIPVTVEFTPKWPNSNVGHVWNSVCDSSGRHISFMGAEKNPGIPHKGSHWSKGKVYRQMFSKQRNINRNSVPAELQNPYIQDVSQEYDGFADVEIPVRYPATDATGYVYLATRDGSLNWNLIGWGQADSQTIRFSSIGKNMLYLPVYYENNNRKPAGYPFWLNSDGTVRIFEPDTTRYEQLSLSTVNHLWNIQNPHEQNIHELFCWMDSTWQSFEKQEARKQLSQFRIPSNALFYLKNNTTERVTGVFTVQNGAIQWL